MTAKASRQKGRWEDSERLAGVPLLSSFISADMDVAIFRKFSRLGARNLLHLQNHLNELESKLDEFDKRDAKKAQGNPLLRQGARAYDSLRDAAFQYENRLGEASVSENSTLNVPEGMFLKDAFERIRLHKEVAHILHQYRQALLEEHQIQTLPQPSTRTLTTFKKYFTDGGNILIGHDKKIIQQEEDLVALGQPSEDDRLSRLVRYTCGYCLQSHKPATTKYHPEIFYFPPRRVQVLSYSITAALCGILLVGAMACLAVLDDRSWKLRIGMVALFTFLFATFVALLTNARRTEVFGATAAYAAVLVVYVSAGLGPRGMTNTGYRTRSPD